MSEKIVAVDRALDILLYLYRSEEERGISEISRELDLPKSTVHRTLVTLEDKRFVYKNEATDKYWLGIRIYAMGALVGEKTSLIDAIKPFAKDLYEEFGEVINVSILDEGSKDGYKSIVIFKESDDSKVLSVNPKIGSSSDAHASSVGKCLLAFNNKLKLEEGPQYELRKHTERTITKWDDLLAELEKVRRDGYSIDNEEQEIGLYCIGAPILNNEGHAVASISISGPTARMKKDDVEIKISKLVKAAKRISVIIGYMNLK